MSATQCAILYEDLISNKVSIRNNLTNPTIIDMLHKEARIYLEGFSDLKPILRTTMQSILYIFTFNAFSGSISNMLNGGHMIRHLSTIPTSRMVDKLFGIKLITITVLFTLGYMVVGIIFYGSYLHGDKSLEWNIPHIAVSTAFNLFSMILVSLYTILFIYSMFMYRHCIEQITNSFRNKSIQFDELQLTMLKDRLNLIGKHFNRTNKYLAFPLTSEIVVEIYLIICSVCYLITNFYRTPKPFSIFFFNFLLHSVVQLFVKCFVGNETTEAYDLLICAIYRRINNWSFQNWAQFNEIKRIRSNFKPLMYDMYKIRQSVVISMLCFALNYIVVLIQTEDYEKKH
ncbi:hypothetical protein RDWZM_003089 [Blomia tropicalis]|uniref:Uncharacterized protein n=1 Tax=Blomia tropicalis TaxID=40697 RepID=A0A9Q0RS70_BLOTA|nr:hypothetical protein RDWZM_003089 [Blomia tropicalis]